MSTGNRLSSKFWIGAILLLALVAWGPWRSGSRGQARPRVVSGAEGFPLTLALPTGDQVVLEAAPRRILPANAAAVDFLSVLVGPERVAALPQAAELYSRLASLPAADLQAWSNVPRFQGYQGEVVLGYGPDLVLAHTWQAPETTAVLLGAGIPVLVEPLPVRWSEILATLRLLGRVLDAEERASEVLAGLEKRRAALAASPTSSRGLRALCYSNLGVGGTAAGADTTADVLFGLAGLRNAAAEAGLSGHQSIDHERLLALDPEVIVVGTVEDSGERPPSETYLLEQPDLASLQAVQRRRIVALPPRLFTTTSQALMEAAEQLAAEVEGLYVEAAQSRD